MHWQLPCQQNGPGSHHCATRLLNALWYSCAVLPGCQHQAWYVSAQVTHCIRDGALVCICIWRMRQCVPMGSRCQYNAVFTCIIYRRWRNQYYVILYYSHGGFCHIPLGFHDTAGAGRVPGVPVLLRSMSLPTANGGGARPRQDPRPMAKHPPGRPDAIPGALEST